MSNLPPDQMKAQGDRPRGQSVPIETYKELHKTNAALLAQIETWKERLATSETDHAEQVAELVQKLAAADNEWQAELKAHAQTQDTLAACQASAAVLAESVQEKMHRLDAFEGATREALVSLLGVMPEGVLE